MEELGRKPNSARLTRPGGRAQVAVLVQTAQEDGRAMHAGAGAEGASAPGDPAAEEADAQEALGEDWTSEQLSDAALIVSSVLAAHAAGSPPVSGLFARCGVKRSENV